MAELFSWPEILTTILDRRDLSVSEATWAMRQVMSGRATPSQLGGFLLALRAKGETVDEIVGFRDAILEAALPLPVPAEVLDIVGTGGDRFGTVNVSTMSAIVAAATLSLVARPTPSVLPCGVCGAVQPAASRQASAIIRALLFTSVRFFVFGSRFRPVPIGRVGHSG